MGRPKRAGALLPILIRTLTRMVESEERRRRRASGVCLECGGPPQRHGDRACQTCVARAIPFV